MFFVLFLCELCVLWGYFLQIDMEKPFVPLDFIVPELLETEHFRLRMLSAADVDKDYEAVMESRALLNAMFGSGWPTEGFTRQENLEDLIEHQQEFEQRIAFAYTVVSPDESVCLGCVYINPRRGHPADARVYLWVRQSAYDRGLDPILFRTVKKWLEDCWPFQNVNFPGRREDGSWEPL
jgi:hypothetical protein